MFWIDFKRSHYGKCGRAGCAGTCLVVGECERRMLVPVKYTLLQILGCFLHFMEQSELAHHTKGTAADVLLFMAGFLQVRSYGTQHLLMVHFWNLTHSLGVKWALCRACNTHLVCSLSRTRCIISIQDGEVLAPCTPSSCQCSYII